MVNTINYEWVSFEHGADFTDESFSEEEVLSPYLIEPTAPQAPTARRRCSNPCLMALGGLTLAGLTTTLTFMLVAVAGAVAGATWLSLS